MTNPTIGTKGALLDLLIRQGATCGPNYMSVKDSGGTAIDLTDVTITAQIRKTADAVTSMADAVVTIDVAANGTFHWQFDATDTAALTCDPVSEKAAASQYVWDMEMKYTTGGRVVPLLYGTVSVFREVTKP